MTTSPTQPGTRWTLTVASVLALASVAAADQIGQARFPTPSNRVGGVRASFPSPHFGTGRNGTLLNRSGSLLPPSPARSLPLANGGFTGGGGGRPLPGCNDGPGRPDRPLTDKPCYAPTPTSGTNVDGSFSDDNFRLKFHLGAGADGYCGTHGSTNPCDPGCHPGCNTGCNPGHVWWNYPWSWGWGWYDDYPSVVYAGPWYGTDPFVTQGVASTSTPAAPASTTTTTPREPTLIERADAAWQSGRPDAAAGLLKQYLATAPDDTDAMRYLALTYIDQKKLDEGVALMAMAYEKTPQLGSRPLPGTAIPGGSDAMRKRVNAVSGFANQSKTASAWLTMAVLVQGEGRLDIARKIAEKAKAAGLSEKVAAELVGSLGN